MATENVDFVVARLVDDRGDLQAKLIYHVTELGGGTPGNLSFYLCIDFLSFPDRVDFSPLCENAMFSMEQILGKANRDNLLIALLGKARRLLKSNIG